VASTRSPGFRGNKYRALVPCENRAPDEVRKTNLTLLMLGNFLKIDYIVVSFFKPKNSACFLWEMMD